MPGPTPPRPQPAFVLSAAAEDRVDVAYAELLAGGLVDPRVAVLLDAVAEGGGAWRPTWICATTGLCVRWRVAVPGDGFEAAGDIMVLAPGDYDLVHIGRVVRALRARSNTTGAKT